MQIGTVIGNVWATKKEDILVGYKFLIIRLEHPSGGEIHSPIIAVDRLGAGIGDQVMVTMGSAARFVNNDTNIPIDAAIIGIIDSIDVEREGT